MKLRIRGNSLRLRLTQTEVAELVRAGRVEDRTQLGQDATLGLVFRLQLSAFRLVPGVEFDGGRITVSLPEAQARSWAPENEAGDAGPVASGNYSFCLSTSSTQEKVFIMVGKPSVVVPNKAT